MALSLFILGSATRCFKYRSTIGACLHYYRYPSLNRSPTCQHVFHCSSSRSPLKMRSLANGLLPEDEVENEVFEKFYFFPYIRGARLFTRLKLYQTGLTVAFVPVMTYMYVTGEAGLAVVGSSVFVASFACVMLYIIGNIAQRTIGMLSLNKAEDILRVSHLTFWGKRNNIYIPVDHVIPLSDLPDLETDVYIKFRWGGSEDFLYLTIPYGRILDKRKYYKVMGKTHVL